jgi:hypothetical protein
MFFPFSILFLFQTEVDTEETLREKLVLVTGIDRLW